MKRRIDVAIAALASLARQQVPGVSVTETAVFDPAEPDPDRPWIQILGPMTGSTFTARVGDVDVSLTDLGGDILDALEGE